MKKRVNFIVLIIGIFLICLSVYIRMQYDILPDLICTNDNSIVNLKSDDFNNICSVCKQNLENVARVSQCKQCGFVIGTEKECENCLTTDTTYLYPEYLKNNNFSFNSIYEYKDYYIYGIFMTILFITMIVIGFVMCFISFANIFCQEDLSKKEPQI